MSLEAYLAARAGLGAPTSGRLRYLSNRDDLRKICSDLFSSNTVPRNESSSSKVRTGVSSETQTDDLPDVCTKDAERERLEAKSISKLSRDLGELLLDDAHHDVTIKVKNREFKAHKVLLQSRSPVFAAMFKHNMKEGASDSVSIEDCDPDTFGEFLRYVYTGKAEFDSAETAISLYYVGDKYDFTELKEMCVMYLTGSITTTVICDVIEMATTYNEADLLEFAVSFFSKKLEEILITVEWQNFLQRNPVAANELYINAVKRGYRKVSQAPVKRKPKNTYKTV